VIIPDSPTRVSGLTVAMKMWPKSNGVAFAASARCTIHAENAN